MKFRKRPIVIDAVAWHGKYSSPSQSCTTAMAYRNWRLSVPSNLPDERDPKICSRISLKTLRKQERRAMRTLIRYHGASPRDFERADGSETINAPLNLRAKNMKHGFITPGVLPGTPIQWCACDYETGECDAYLPSEILKLAKWVPDASL